MGEAPAVLSDPVFEEIAVADTVRSAAAAEGRLPEKIRHLDSTRLLAEAIIAVHAGR
jgi:phosphoribosylpyrophosphate synthetase